MKIDILSISHINCSTEKAAPLLMLLHKKPEAFLAFHNWLERKNNAKNETTFLPKVQNAYKESEALSKHFPKIEDITEKTFKYHEDLALYVFIELFSDYECQI